MKKSFAAIAVVLAAGLTLTAAGCSNSNSKNLAVLSSNWYTGTTFYGFQPSICEGNENFAKEKIVYSVKHEQPEQSYANETYSVEYAEEDAFYSTEFYAATFSAKNFPEGLKENYDKADKFTAYCYKTELYIPSVKYTLKSDSENPKTFEDQSVITESWFLSVNDYLRPLYSKQVVNSVTPWKLKPKKLEEGDAYKTFNLTYESFYSYDGKSVTTVLTEGGVEGAKPQESKNEKLNKAKYSLFDPFAQDIVVRASDLYSAENLSQPVSFYIPKSGKIENFTLTGFNAAIKFDDDAQKDNVIDELIEAGLYEESKPAASDDAENTENEENKENQNKTRTLKTVAVTVSYTSGSQPGGTQTYWFTSVTDKRANIGRATMLRTATPLSYNLGTLVYTLKDIEQSLNKK